VVVRDDQLAPTFGHEQDVDTQSCAASMVGGYPEVPSMGQLFFDVTA
jgi:hypothetical protein